MLAKQIVSGLYAIAVGPVNTFLVTSPDGDTLIDSGLPGSADKILQAVRELGKQASDIRHVMLTHAHPDHIGSAAALKRATDAKVYIHPLDAAIASAGAGFRSMKPAPGLMKGLLFRMFVHTNVTVEGVAIDHHVNDGDAVPFAGGMKAIHAPGHCAGQLALFWPQHGGVLFVADACSNMMGLGWSLGYEDLEEGKRTLKKLAHLNFQTVCFGHGKAIAQNARAQFSNKWG